MKLDTPATLKSLLNCAQPSPIIGYTARKIANSIISLIIKQLQHILEIRQPKLILLEVLILLGFYSMVLTNPMPSMHRYTKYITVKPKLWRLNAPYIRNTVAIRKKMQAMNIGGFGEYHIKISEAIRLDTIPITSQQNLLGLDL